MYPPTNTDDEVDFGLRWHIKVTRCPSNTFQADLLLFPSKVFLHIRFCTLEDDSAFCFLGLITSSVCKTHEHFHRIEFSPERWI
jgi:hypothetical protein